MLLTAFALKKERTASVHGLHTRMCTFPSVTVSPAVQHKHGSGAKMSCLQAKGEELSLSELQAEINKHQRELLALQSALPTIVNLGLASLHLGKVSYHILKHGLGHT